jgi:xylan 1,4-beta-xylosidase
MARSRAVTGPYELDPQHSVLTSRDDPALPLQKAGHGELVQTRAGEWFLAHLASRPIGPPEQRRCILGRETCLQRVLWTADGWLRLAHGGWHPAVEVAAPQGLPLSPWPDAPARDDFDANALDTHWNTLRVPVDDSWLSLRARPGWLRLRGHESLHSLFEQSLVARRLQGFHAVVETCLEFRPAHFTQAAGLICWYDTRTHYYLRVTYEEGVGPVLGPVLTDDGVYDELLESQVAVESWERYYLRAEIDHDRLQFHASPDARAWQPIGPALDASKLSDDYGSVLHFTGALVGVCAQDLGGTRAVTADFDYFELRPERAQRSSTRR